MARAAGVPNSVLDRSRELLARTTAGTAPNGGPDERAGSSAAAANGTDGNGVDTGSDPGAETVAARLREINVADTTPMEALRLLDELQREVE